MKMGQSSAEKARKAINVAEIWSKVSHLLSTKKFWMELLVMTVGMFVASSAVHFFQVPSKLVIGSFSGLALVVYQLFPIVSVGTYLLLINIVLLILSFILLGNEFGAKTVYTSLIVGPMVDFLQWLFPMKQSLFAVTIAGTGQVMLDPWFDLLCFVLVLGLSQSILFSINASTGGLDIVAKIVNKYCHLNLGSSVMVCGCVICSMAILVNDISMVLVGLIGTWLNGLVINYFMEKINQKTRVFIISDDHEKIQQYVINTMRRGLTLHPVYGGYSNQRQMQIEVVLPRRVLRLGRFHAQGEDTILHDLRYGQPGAWYMEQAPPARLLGRMRLPLSAVDVLNGFCWAGLRTQSACLWTQSECQ